MSKFVVLRLAGILAVLVLPGCASITSSDSQSLTLSVYDEKKEQIKDADCSLKNDRGTWKAKAPAVVEVRRSAEDLMVECQKEGAPNGFLRAISRAAGGMFGNIIFGGGIGAIIDHSRGTGYNYPDDLPVVLGKTITVDRGQQNTPAENSASGAAAQ